MDHLEKLGYDFEDDVSLHSIFGKSLDNFNPTSNLLKANIEYVSAVFGVSGVESTVDNFVDKTSREVSWGFASMVQRFEMGNRYFVTIPDKIAAPRLAPFLSVVPFESKVFVCKEPQVFSHLLATGLSIFPLVDMQEIELFGLEVRQLEWRVYRVKFSVVYLKDVKAGFVGRAPRPVLQRSAGFSLKRTRTGSLAGLSKVLNILEEVSRRSQVYSCLNSPDKLAKLRPVNTNECYKAFQMQLASILSKLRKLDTGHYFEDYFTNMEARISLGDYAFPDEFDQDVIKLATDCESRYGTDHIRTRESLRIRRSFTKYLYSSAFVGYESLAPFPTTDVYDSEFDHSLDVD